MNKSFYLSSTASDLTTGADFALLLDSATAASSPLNVGVAAGATESSRGYAPAGVPGAGYTLESATVKVSVLVASANMAIGVALIRLDASGALVGSTGVSAYQNAGSVGVLTFDFPAPLVGSHSYGAGDRFAVSYAFQAVGGGMSGASVQIDRNTINTEVACVFTQGNGSGMMLLM